MKQKKILIIFRYDDYSAKNEGVFDKKLVETFRKNGVRPTFSIIPCICKGDVHDPSSQSLELFDGENACFVKDAVRDNIIEVAQHGFTHQTSSCTVKSEFIGVPFEEQLKKIAEGARVLKEATGQFVRVFVPPWNRYDLTTIATLEQLGFSIISASLDGPADLCSGLKFLPATSEVKNLRDAVKSAKRFYDSQAIIVCMLHSYDFSEVDNERGCITNENFNELIQWIRSEEDVQIVSIRDVQKIDHDLGPQRYALNKMYSRFSSLLPFNLRKLIPSSGVYWSSKETLKVGICFIVIFYLVLFTAFVIIACFGYKEGVEKLPQVSWIIRFGSLALISIISGYVLWRGQLLRRTALKITSLMGLSAGVWIAYFLWGS